jgi:hypothetical protein
MRSPLLIDVPGCVGVEVDAAPSPRSLRGRSPEASGSGHIDVNNVHHIDPLTAPRPRDPQPRSVSGPRERRGLWGQAPLSVDEVFSVDLHVRGLPSTHAATRSLKPMPTLAFGVPIAIWRLGSASACRVARPGRGRSTACLGGERPRRR